MYLRYILKIEKSSSLSWRTLFKYNNENNMWKNNVNSSTWWNENNPNKKQSSVFWEANNKRILLLKILDEWDRSPETISRFLEKYKNLVSWTINMDELIKKSLSYRWEELAQGVAISMNPVRKIEKNLEKVPKQIRNRIFSNMSHLWLREHITKTSHSVDRSTWKVTTHSETIKINQDMIKALENIKSTQNKT